MRVLVVELLRMLQVCHAQRMCLLAIRSNF